jgi:hypothetical protein
LEGKGEGEVDVEGEQSTYILNDVAMVADEEEGAAVLHVDLHADQACTELVDVMSGSEGIHNNIPSVCPGRWCRVMPWQKSKVWS